MNIKIQTDTPSLYSFIANNIPNGIKLISSPPIEYKTFNMDVSISIDIVVDLCKITAPFVAAWLIKILRSGGGKNKINIDGKNIAIDQTKIENVLEQAIKNKKS